MQLSLRLSAIAGLVTRGNRLVDVGCDMRGCLIFLKNFQKNAEQHLNRN